MNANLKIALYSFSREFQALFQTAFSKVCPGANPSTLTDVRQIRACFLYNKY